MVGPGFSFPADGRVLIGFSKILRTCVSAETSTILVGPGDEVLAGCINKGNITVEIEASLVGHDS